MNDKRNTEQNAKMWAMLHDISHQVEWRTAQGEPCHPSADDWKDIITAYLKGQRMYVGIDSGIVMCGESTRKMSKKDVAELIECLYWFGAERRVVWSDPKFINIGE